MVARSIARRIRRRKKKFTKHPSREKIHNYWSNPPPNENQPDRYVIPEKRSLFLLAIIEKYLTNSSSSILELGCNVGRNLNILREKYSNLAGIEISSNALKLGWKEYPSLYQECVFYNSSIEDQLSQFKEEGQEFDLIFSMAVLQHIHYDSDFILDRIAELTNLVIVVEDENCISERHFPRNYKEVFEKRGFKQIEEINSLLVFGFDNNFVARILRKEGS